MGLLQLLLGPLQLLLQHGHLSRQVLPLGLVPVPFVRAGLVPLEAGLGVGQRGLGEVELVLERGDLLVLFEEFLLVLRA